MYDCMAEEREQPRSSIGGEAATSLAEKTRVRTIALVDRVETLLGPILRPEPTMKGLSNDVPDSRQAYSLIFDSIYCNLDGANCALNRLEAILNRVDL